MTTEELNADYMAKEIHAKLVGTIITQPVLDGEGNFGFQCASKEGTFIVWVDRDPEGNGPGWLKIVEDKS